MVMIMEMAVENLADATQHASPGYVMPSHSGLKMDDRGWTLDDVENALTSPEAIVGTFDSKTQDPATAFYIDSNNCVIQNNVTLEIIQISNRNDPNWVGPLNPNYDGPWDPTIYTHKEVLMSIKDTIREYLPGRHREKGGEMYFTLDDAKDLLKLAKSSGWLVFGVEYFIEVDRVHYSPVGVDYWPDNVSMEARYKELGNCTRTASGR